jgi:transitional endoplasmic reticulum ATPase
MRFRDEDGDIIDMPEPKFIDTNDVDEAMLVYPAKTQAAIETNLFTPIQRIRDCIANGIPVKRGVLLGGTFGTGKTMAAKVASKYAVQNGITYLYVTRADELADAIEFAKMYCDPGCVIFCEDIDRAMEGNNAERTEAIDDILNIIDGIDTKSSNIITVLTTNSLETITPAMLRPGRLDAVIDVLPPDAAAAEKLVRLYAGDAVDIDADLSEVGQKLDGVIPAVIAEVVKRAKLAQLRLQEPGTLVTKLSAQALLDASESMKSQLDLLYREEVKDETTIDSLVKGAIESVIAKHLGDTISMVSKVDDRVEDIHNRIC